MADMSGVILNVDDYEAARYVRTQILQRAGFQVIEAGTGGDALRIVAEQRPDLVLLDINLPDIHGFEVCRRLREQVGTIAVPVVHISSTFVNERAQQLALEGGADGYLTEPVEPPVLLATVHALLRLRRAEEGLSAAGRRWQLSFDAIGDGICLTTADGVVVQCNAAFARLVGRVPQDLVGTSWNALWASFGHPRAESPPIRLGLTPSPKAVELPRDGRWFRLRVEPILEGSGIAGVVSTISDITAERHAQEARAALLAREQAAREEAEAANRAKDEFLAMLGHELRNPLDVIASAVQVLDVIGSQDPQAAHTREVITRQVRQLGRLVDDLLDVSRVSTGKISLSRRPIDLSEIVRRCVGTLDGAGQTGQHRLSVRAEPTWVEGDQARLEQVVMNLLSNAIKYTPAGGAIQASVSGDGTTARLSVTDTGAGIAPEMLERIFDLFFQGARTLDRAEGGLGIGLTLVRRLVEMHGGKTSVSSEGTGRGSTFLIELPQIPAVASRPDRSQAARPASGQPRRILIVEDNQDSREMLRILLERAGHEVSEASDGASGLAAVVSTRPDVALVDLGLPGLDGFEVARRVRASEAGRSVRLVALTGYGLPADQHRSREAGFDAHLVKPVDPQRLVRLIAGDSVDD
jgi:PAS domain S-box-containing protein